MMPTVLGDLRLVTCRTCHEPTYELPELIGEDGQTECPSCVDPEDAALIGTLAGDDDAALDEWADEQAARSEAGL